MLFYNLIPGCSLFSAAWFTIILVRQFAAHRAVEHNSRADRHGQDMTTIFGAHPVKLHHVTLLDDISATRQLHLGE